MADLTKFFTKVFYKHGMQQYGDPLGEARRVLEIAPDHSLSVTSDGKLHQVYHPQALLDADQVYKRSDVPQVSSPRPSSNSVRPVNMPNQDTLKNILGGKDDEEVDEELFPDLKSKPTPVTIDPAVLAVLKLIESLTSNETAWLENLVQGNKQVPKNDFQQALEQKQALHLDRISPPNQKIALVKRSLVKEGEETYIVFSLSSLGKVAFDYIVTQGKDSKIKDNLINLIKQALS